MSLPEDDKIIPLHEERLKVGKRTVATDITTVSTRTETVNEEVNLELAINDFQIERVPVGQIVDTLPTVREEGDTIIIPIYEEVVVKRIKLVEEIRITSYKSIHQHTETVSLRKEVVEISTGKDQK